MGIVEGGVVGIVEGGVCGYGGGRCVCRCGYSGWRCVGVGMMEVCMGVGIVEGGMCGCGYSRGRYVCGLFCTMRLHSKSKVLWYMYVWCLW